MRVFLLAAAIVLAVIGISSRMSKKDAPSQATSGDSQVLANVSDEAGSKEPGPPRVGLQVGHWKNDELPDEFGKLRIEGTGTSWGSITEWEVVLEIAEQAAEVLRERGVEVDVIPATVPKGYEADAFVSLHADGNEDTSVYGYVVAPSIFDETGVSEDLAAAIQASYGERTGQELGPLASEDMQRYYAFNYNRFEHSVHPDTPSAIIETGFLSNTSDRRFLVQKPDLAAKGIAEGILSFIKQRGRL